MNAAEELDDGDDDQDGSGTLDALDGAEVEDEEPTLPMLDYASLRAGLDCLPHRRLEVAQKFGLATRARLQRELDAWQRRLAKNTRESRELDAMRARMTDFWMRYGRAAETIPAPACAPVPSAPSRVSLPTMPTIARSEGAFNPRSRIVARARPAVPTVPAPEVPEVMEPSLALERYALLCFAAEHLHDRVDALFEEMGLADPSARRRVDAEWQERLRVDVHAYGRWCMCIGRLRALHEIT